MTTSVKKKIIIAAVLEIICVIALGLFLCHIQRNVAIDRCRADLQDKVPQIQETIDSSTEIADQEESSYDEVYSSKATSIAYIAKNSKTYKQSDAQMAKLADQMNLTNICIVDKSGKLLAAAKTPLADFKSSRFNQLRTVFSSDKAAEPFTVNYSKDKRRYYAAAIDSQKEVVLEHDPEELETLMDDTSSWKAMLSKVSVGLNGFAFAISAQDYTFDYYPEDDVTGSDALKAGIKASDLEQDHYGWMSINGERYYCGVAEVEAEDAYVVCAIPESEIMSSSTMTTGIVLFVFFMVITLVNAYAVILLREQDARRVFGNSKNGHDDSSDDLGAADRSRYISIGKFIFDKKTGVRLGVVTVLGLVAIVAVSFYMQTLFSISSHSISNMENTQAVEDTLKENEETVNMLVKQYNRRYLNKALVAADILDDNPQLWNREDLSEMCDALDIEGIEIFDNTGTEILSDSTSANFKISSDPDDQSYIFNRLLYGEKYVIQEARKDESSGEYQQYIGALLVDEKGNANGFVQTKNSPDRLNNTLEATTLDSVLSNVKPGTNGFAFAVSSAKKSLGKFTFYPEDTRLEGRSALEYGLEKDQMKDGFNDYVTINHHKYFATCLETDDNYVYVAIPNGEMINNRIPLVLTTGIASLICLAVMFFISTFRRARDEAGAAEDDDADESIVRPMHKNKSDERAAESDEHDGDGNGGTFEVILPDGTAKRTESAESRWAYTNRKWSEFSPEQKLGTILKVLVSAFALFIFFGVLFEDKIFDDTSVFRYIIDGRWEKGFSIFSVTACIMIVCVIAVISMIVRMVCNSLSKVIGSRGATICRLLRSVVKYMAIIVGLYYCLAQMGVDTKTLLASAGILSLVIGLGAQKLISDILAGLFIIFEGEFRVGDIVTIGDWRGTVMEIGVRTTKVESPGNDIKVFANSAVSGVINMTRSSSYASIEVAIDHNESLEKVEAVFKKEFPKLKRKYPDMIGGPQYMGVSKIEGNMIYLRVLCQCSENNRMQVIRDLNRSIKLMFEKNDIRLA